MSGSGTRVALRLTLLTAGAGALPWWTALVTSGLRHPAGATFADLLAAAGAWLLLACAAWGAAACFAVVLEVLSTGRLRATAWVGCPPALLRVVTATLGLALAGTWPAAASPTRIAESCRPGPWSHLPVPARGARPRLPLRRGSGSPCERATRCGASPNGGCTAPRPAGQRPSPSCCTGPIAT